MSTEFWTILGVGVAVIGLNWRMYGVYAETSATFAVKLLICANAWRGLKECSKRCATS